MVDNDTSNPIEVFIFTKLAIFNSSEGVYTSSLGSQIVQSKRQSHQAQFTIERSYFAAAQKLDALTAAGGLQYKSVALRPITIKTDSQPAQRTKLSFDDDLCPILSTPKDITAPDGSPANVVEGSFQIQTPLYPDGQGDYGIGLGLISNGQYLLSSYTMARPNQFVDVQPINIFYIAIGGVVKGQEANYYTASTTAALCDGTDGTTTFHVVHKNDGRWAVNGKIQSSSPSYS